MSIKDKPKIFAVIGDPLSHSKSPEIFNAAFKALGLNAEYQIIKIETSKLECFFKKMREGEISGVNVTIPHKQSVLKFCDDISDFAKKVGAVNTIVLKNKKLFGDNTDGPGYIRSLATLPSFKLKSSHVVVLGSGGASHGICFALCEQDILSLTIANRTISNAEKLKNDLAKNFPLVKFETTEIKSLENSLTYCDLLINTTLSGMAGHTWSDLNFLKNLKKKSVVSDIVYNPQDTEMLIVAKKLGHRVHYGYTMLLHQAILAFEIFTGKPAPREIMEKVLLKTLGC